MSKYGWKKTKLIRVINQTFAELMNGISDHPDIGPKEQRDLYRICRARRDAEVARVKAGEGLCELHPGWMRGE